MNRLEKLIAKLCPNGVEYKPLGEVATVERGNGLAKSDFVNKGVPCIHYGQLYTRFNTCAEKTLTFVSEDTAASLKRLHPGDILMAVTSENIEDVCKCIAWLGDNDVVVGGHTAIIRHQLNPKYLAYWFQTEEFFAQKRRLAHGTKVIEVTPSCLTGVVLPVPPRSVQEEIVRMLDDMAGLIVELEQELAARKQQYEWYRESMVKATAAKMVTLGDVADVTKLAGFEFTKYMRYKKDGEKIALRGLNVKNGHLALDEVKYIDGSDFSMLDRSRLKAGDMLFTYVGTVGQVALVDVENKYWLAPNVSRIRFNVEVIAPEFMKYYFQTWAFHDGEMKRYMGASSMENLTMGNIRKFQIPLPPLSEQKKIAARLDAFDKLCNSMTEGLPGEIAARKQQYEYYRDKLLTFKKAG